MAPVSKPSPAAPRAYRLKVTLQDVRPPIWRRFTVRDDLTLLKLHQLLQIIMGWTDSHLHQFIAGSTYLSRPEFELSSPRKDESRVRLRDVLKKPSDRLVYEYDFGDGWEHAIVLEQALPHEPRARYPVILDGKRSCPPDDCGGPSGYAHMLEVLAKPTHPEHEELREWVGEGFDAERFDIRAMNRAFHGGWYLPDEEKPGPAIARPQSRQTTLRLGPPKRG